jgi:hypothetical protein
VVERITILLVEENEEDVRWMEQAVQGIFTLNIKLFHSVHRDGVMNEKEISLI